MANGIGVDLLNSIWLGWLSVIRVIMAGRWQFAS
jgi:hypothetical protein